MYSLTILDLINDRDLVVELENLETGQKEIKHFTCSSDWFNFIRDNKYSVKAFKKPINITWFPLTSKFIDDCESAGLIDSIIIPNRKDCPEEVREFIDGYLIDNKQVEQTEEILLQLSDLAEDHIFTEELPLFRGTYLEGGHLPKIGDILYQKGLKSWSKDYLTALSFAQNEQYFIDASDPPNSSSKDIACLYELVGKVFSFIPTEYCSKDSYLVYKNEVEYITVDGAFKVTDVSEVWEDDNPGNSPIYLIKLESVNFRIEEIHSERVTGF